MPIDTIDTINTIVPIILSEREDQKSRLAWVRVSGLPMSMRLRLLQQYPLMPLMPIGDGEVSSASEMSLLPACDR